MYLRKSGMVTHDLLYVPLSLELARGAAVQAVL